MQEKVEQYLQKVERYEQKLNDDANKARQEQEDRYKREVLERTGFIKKEYREKGEKKEDFPFYDKDSMSYYRENITELTEEEWQAVEAAYKKVQRLKKEFATTAPTADEERDKTGNSIAKTLKAIAVIIYICALIAGIVAAATAGSIGVGIMFGVWFGGFIFGTMMFGFSEVIRLLDSINKK